MACARQGASVDARREGLIGIIGAMEVEVALLREAMGEAQVAERAGCTFLSGAIDGVACVVVRCGVGMVNAAACAQALIDRFGVRCIVNTGVAGSLDPQLARGDLVVASDAVNWLMDVQNLGYAPGQTPQMASPFLPASETLGSVVLETARAMDVQAVCGRVASGDRFVRDAQEKERIANTFGALCCEMEGASIAQVCQANGVPCAILRVISDSADGTDAEDYDVFEARAAHLCASILHRAIARM